MLQGSVRATMATKSVEVQMKELLDEFNSDLADTVETAQAASAKRTAQLLRNISPKQNGGKHPGRYARGWSVKKLDRLTTVVYNRTDYQLTHLLENGHAVKPDPKRPGKKDRVAGIPHISKAEEYAQEDFPVRILRGIKG